MVKIAMTSNDAHSSFLIPYTSKPIRVQREADDSHLTTSPENQSFDGLYFDDGRLCPQCGQDHSYKLTSGSSILDMISFLDRRYTR